MSVFETILGSGDPAVGRANRAFAYLFAVYAGLLAGLLRSMPQLSDAEYVPFLRWGAGALLAALFFSAIATKDHPSRATLLFRCGLAAVAAFFIGFVLAAWNPALLAGTRMIDLATVLAILSGVAILARLAMIIGFPKLAEAPSFFAVIALIIYYVQSTFQSNVHGIF